MFDKLKRKFILINMSLLTAVFVGIFGSIFLTNTIRINNDIERTLYKVIRDPIKQGPKEPSLFFNIIIDVDNSGNILRTATALDIDNEELENISNVVFNNKNDSDKVTINNEKYAYLKQPTNIGTRIALINIQAQSDSMFKLLESFTIIGAISLIVLLVISIYLTNKTIKPIKETFEKQKQFIADASHELRTPLTIIKTNASVILGNSNDTVKNQSKWLNYITLQADRMSELVNEMLSLAKLDTTDNNVNLVPINLSKVISSMTLSFEAVLFENGIELEENIKKDISILGDEVNIKKLFSIFMDNAIKHTNKNGKIIVDLYQEKNKIKFTVKNTGDGISDEHIEKIFERFYRVDTSRDRQTGGYGLGLSIAKSIVEQHKGKIYAESNLGVDTTFIVEFPKV